MVRQRRKDAKSSVTLAVAVVVGVVWAVIYLHAAIDPSFSPPPEVSTVMLAALAGLYAAGVRK